MKKLCALIASLLIAGPAMASPTPPNVPSNQLIITFYTAYAPVLTPFLTAHGYFISDVNYRNKKRTLETIVAIYKGTGGPTLDADQVNAELALIYMLPPPSYPVFGPFHPAPGQIGFE